MKEIHLYRVTENPIEIQNRIKNHALDTLPKFLVGIFLIMLIENWFPEVVSLAFPTTIGDVIAHYNPALDAKTIASIPRMPVMLYVYALLFNGVFKLGEALFALTYIRSHEVDFRALFEGISLYVKVLGMYILQTLIISFWSMCFVIPGIIAALNFSQSFYILADDPSKSIPFVLNESKLRMRGNRIAYIKLLISYLPYILISLIPNIILSYFVNIDTTTIAGVGLDLLANTFFYTAFGLLVLGQCVFYELLITGGFNNFKYRGEESFRQ